jgi:hypothetical protein
VAIRGERNNNPGNIDKEPEPFQGEVPGSDSRFCTFSTPVYGIRAIAVLVLAYYQNHGLNTIQGIINRWAPSVENNTSAYVTDVCNRVGAAPTDVIAVDDPEVLEKIVTAIIWHENGRCIYSPQQIEDGVDAAL